MITTASEVRRTRLTPIDCADPAVRVWAEPGMEAKVRARAKTIESMKPEKPKRTSGIGGKGFGMPSRASSEASRIKQFVAGRATGCRVSGDDPIAGVCKRGPYLCATDGQTLWRLRHDHAGDDGHYKVTKAGALGDFIPTNGRQHRPYEIIDQRNMADVKVRAQNVPLEGAIRGMRSVLRFLHYPDCNAVLVVLNDNGSLGFIGHCPVMGDANVTAYRHHIVLGGFTRLFRKTLEWHWKMGDKAVDIHWSAWNKPMRMEGDSGDTLSLVMPSEIPEAAEELAKAVH